MSKGTTDKIINLLLTRIVFFIKHLAYINESVKFSIGYQAYMTDWLLLCDTNMTG